MDEDESPVSPEEQDPAPAGLPAAEVMTAPPIGPASAPPSPGRPRLRRRVHDRVIAGVAGGLADYLGVSAFLVRALFGFALFMVVLLRLRPWNVLPEVSQIGLYRIYPQVSPFLGLVTAGSGLAVLAYVVLWVLVPAEDTGVSAARTLGHRMPRFSGVRTWLSMIALVGGGSLLGYELGLWSPDVVWPFLLIGAGVLLFRRDAERSNGLARNVAGRPAAPMGAPLPPTAPGAWPAEPASSAAASITVPPRPPRERSPLGWLVLGIALLVVGGAAILQNLGGLHLELVRYPALALVVLGIGMLVGAFVGRARWLLLPAVGLVPLVLGLSLVDVPLEGGFNDIYESPRTPADVHAAYRTIVGDVYVDLSGLWCRHDTITVAESSGFGTVSLYLPFDAHVVATGSTGLGSVQLGNIVVNGAERHLHETFQPPFGDGITVVADLQGGIGNVYVFRQKLVKKQRDKACA